MSHLTSLPRAGLEQRLIARLAGMSLPHGSIICLGFSGGNDSLALAIALSRIKTSFHIHPVLVHVDHQLRSGSERGAAQSRDLATAIGLPIFLEALPEGIVDRAKGVGVEEQARRERYVALSRHCQNLDARHLLTGHHLDDQAETVLMHVFRGSGTKGAAGMRELSTIQIPWWELQPKQEIEPLVTLLWRPFLYERKRTLEDYVAAAGLTPVEDESNASTEFRRNAVRHQVLPGIEKNWPGSIEAIGRFSGSLALDDELLTSLAFKGAQNAMTDDGALSIAALRIEHAAIARRIVRDWLERGGVREPALERIVTILDLADIGSESTVLEAGDNQCVTRFDQTLRIGTYRELVEHAMASVPGLAQLPEPDRGLFHLVRKGDSQTAHGTDWTMHFSISDHPDENQLPGFTANSVPIHCSPVGLTIVVRQIRTGDRWFESGAPVRESLRAAGVHPLARHAVVCVASDKDVLFIPNIQQPNIRNKQELEPAAWLNLQWKRS
jgi:tRNA(Ile)-lysidine synthetase-like protein